jgi:hypothetical protein
MSDAADRSADLFNLSPRLWFGLLCEGVVVDQAGRPSFQAVFNQIALFDPPDGTGVPSHAFLHGVLALGLTEGLGQFEVEIELRNIEDHTLWQRPEGRWKFDMGPGNPTAVLVEAVRYWLREPGRYHFWIHVLPTEEEYAIPFEAGRQIGPGTVVQGDRPAGPQ